MIYFMRADEDGPVKIGWSKNPVLRSLQVRPTLLTQLAIIRLIDGDPWVEKWFHQQFNDERIKGEWFTFNHRMLTLDPPAEKPEKAPHCHGVKKWTGKDAHKTGRTEQIVARVPIEDAAALRVEAAARSLTTSGAVKQAIQQWLDPEIAGLKDRAAWFASKETGWECQSRAASEVIAKQEATISDLCAIAREQGCKLLDLKDALAAAQSRPQVAALPVSMTVTPPRHDLAAQVRALGADSLLPDSLPRLTDFPARPMGLKNKGKKA